MQKMKKNAKKCKKICTYQKKVVPLHRQMKKTQKRTPKSNQKNNKIMNKNYLTKSYGEIQLNTATINRNFRIKVNGNVNGVKVNKLVGVSGLLAILGGSWDKLVKFVLRAFNSLADKCACKIYGGATVTFYAK